MGEHSMVTITLATKPPAGATLPMAKVRERR